ncbi:MAG: MMPL family transporter [Lachnospiraceae bacterium]|nr:MMPL family transporter [Lachnospiraceae bacterium]
MKLGEWIAKQRLLILLIGILLLIPSVIGIVKTRVNYDLLSYLPDTLETVKGQDVMVDEFGTGAFAMCVIDGMPMKEVQKMADEFKQIDHVKDVLWYGEVMDISVPTQLLPDNLRKKFFDGEAQLMVVFYDGTTSSDESMGALTEMRRIADKRCFIGGMTGIVTDIKDLCMQELPVYVVIAAILSFIILLLATESYIVPIFFLLGIGISILYNLGSNFFLGSISYVTQALTAVLQLAVTTDYSIFLLESYEENKEHYPEDREKAMGAAISRTFRSIVGSSVTTVAGFLALCVMTFALGKDIGIVMSKGVLIGVVCCVTILPSMILVFDKQIEKTSHKRIIPSLDKISDFIIRHYRVWVLVLLVMAAPALYGSKNVSVYYNIAQSLPDDILSNIANKKLQDTFHMNATHVILLDKDLDGKTKREIMSEVEKLEGVKSTVSVSSLIGPLFPKEMIPHDILKMLESDEHEMGLVVSEYEPATHEVNDQIAKINSIVKTKDPGALVIGEAPMMKDLEDTTNVDLKRVNFLSMAAIFIIILLVFKSISLPFLLVLIIEFAINVNMAVPYYQHISLAFVASIVIGTIQLGATVDYAILMTSRYLAERMAGRTKMESVSIAHKACILSIITSGMSFFVATFGVSAYSRVDMIGSICTLLARGALVSMASVILLMPAMFIIFDGLIIRTTAGFRNRKAVSTDKPVLKSR